jgi:hypothetical protein
MFKIVKIIEKIQNKFMMTKIILMNKFKMNMNFSS